MNTASALYELNAHSLIGQASLQLTPQEPLNTPITRLNSFLAPLQWRGQISEWGVPAGSVARLLPAIVGKALNLECLWISDQSSAQIYPNTWTGLGFNLNNLHFLQDPNPLASLRTVVTENTFPFLIVDCKHRLQKSDLHFLAQHCRQQGSTLFLFRHFYLSNKNGNPFSQQRLNSSYNMARQSFQLSKIKGPGAKKHLHLKLSEVLCG